MLLERVNLQIFKVHLKNVIFFFLMPGQSTEYFTTSTSTLIECLRLIPNIRLGYFAITK